MPKNEYTAVAGAEKRLGEIFRDGIPEVLMPGHLLEQVTRSLTGNGATIEYKPRLKSLVITLPIPQPAPEPKLGEFVPKPEREDGYQDLPTED